MGMIPRPADRPQPVPSLSSSATPERRSVPAAETTGFRLPDPTPRPLRLVSPPSLSPAEAALATTPPEPRFSSRRNHSRNWKAVPENLKRTRGQGDKETRGKKTALLALRAGVSFSPCPLVSLSPCPF